MWKIAIVLCVAVFVLVKGDAPKETVDTIKVLATLDKAKEQINEIMKGVYQRGLGHGEKARNDLVNYAKTIRFGLNKKMNEVSENQTSCINKATGEEKLGRFSCQIHKEIKELFENVSDRIKEECNEFTDGLDEKKKKLDEIMSDCIVHTMAEAIEKLSDAFSSANHGLSMLEISRGTVEVCDIIENCDTCERDVLEYRDEAVTRVTAAHEEYVKKIGTFSIFEECINKDPDYGFEGFSVLLSRVVGETESCIAELDDSTGSAESSIGA